MRKTALSLFASAAVLMAVAGIQPALADEAALEEGKAISFDRKLGNCLACHVIEGGNLPGNIGPPLVAMQARYPSKQDLHDQIYDAREMNPNTMMPPFGAHEVLTEDELKKVVDFIYTL